MGITSAYVLGVSMDVAPEAEDLFNEVYEEHAAFLLQVPGVRTVTRMKSERRASDCRGTMRLCQRDSSRSAKRRP